MWTSRVPFCGRRGDPKPYMGTQVYTRDVHNVMNVDAAGFLFFGSHGRLICVPSLHRIVTTVAHFEVNPISNKCDRCYHPMHSDCTYVTYFNVEGISNYATTIQYECFDEYFHPTSMV